MSYISEHQKEIRANFLESFSNLNDVLNKSMTEDDFNKEFVNDKHEIYSIDGLAKIEKALQDKFVDRKSEYNEGLKEIASELTQIDVKTDGGIITKYVRVKK